MQGCHAVKYEFERIDGEKLGEMIAALPCRAMNAIICGSGEQGELLRDFLESAGIAVECFCDDGSGAAGDARMDERGPTRCGKPVISLGELPKRYRGETIFVALSNPGQELREALAKCGASSSNVIHAPFKTVSGHFPVPADAMPAEHADKYELCQVAKSLSPAGTGQLAGMAPPMLFAPIPAEAAAAVGTQIEALAEPPILVCTAVYNVRASYLRRAIESVLNQTFARFRYLIVDNGSTDGSAAIISEYARADKRIEVLTRHTNISGAKWGTESSAGRYRKEFYDRLTAKYFCMLDSDDCYDSDFLQTTYELAELHGADIVSAGALQYKEDNPGKIYCLGTPLGTRVYSGDKISAMLDYVHIWRPVWGKLMKTGVYAFTSGDGIDGIDGIKAAMSRVGNIHDVYNMFRRFQSSRAVAMTERILCYHTYRRASVSNNLEESSNPVKRVYFLNDWLLGALREAGETSAKSVAAVGNFAFKHIYYPDLDILDRAKLAAPELVCKTARSILETPVPDNLRQDGRMELVLKKLGEILAGAEGRLRESQAGGGLADSPAPAESREPQAPAELHEPPGLPGRRAG